MFSDRGVVHTKVTFRERLSRIPCFLRRLEVALLSFVLVSLAMRVKYVHAALFPLVLPRRDFFFPLI